MVKRILDLVHERFEEMVERRQAPDDLVLYDAAVLTARYDQEITSVLTLYVSIACPEHGDKAFAACSAFVSVDSVLDPSHEPLDQFLESVWDTLMSSRAELALEDVDSSGGV